MRNDIQFDGIKFSIDESIIHCTLDNDFLQKHNYIDIQEVFYNGISILSNGKYLPILINLEHVGFSDTIKIFKFLSICSLIKSLVISKTFMVDSLSLKVILSIYNISSDPIVPNRVCRDIDVALKHCNKENLVFNV
jgi:hypothetical protein